MGERSTGRSDAFFFYAGVFLVAASTLILQIVQTRILSVVAWYHLAFFVISMAMFGLTGGAVLIYLGGGRFSERTLSYDLTYFSAAFSLTTVVALIVQMTLAPIVSLTMTAVVVWAILALCMAVPFFFAGAFMSLALTRSPFVVGRVYGVDLFGAAVGCLAALALLNITDAPSGVLWVGVLAATAALCTARSLIGGSPEVTPPMGALVTNRRTLFCVVLFVALVNGMTDRGLHPLFVKGKIERLANAPLLIEWNSFSRVALFDVGNVPPLMWGAAAGFVSDQWRIEQRYLNIDGDAGSIYFGVRGDVTKADFLKYDITNLAYYLPGQHRAAIIGVGGGRDMLAARAFGVPSITGIEINPILTRLLQNKSGFADFVGLQSMPGMRIEVDEARSWFTRTEQTFDIIQMSLIDTWAATGAGAFTLSENGLYTIEAWQIFLRHLSQDGVFTVSRWYSPGEVNETGRMVSLAMASLFRMGVTDPRRHIFLVSLRNIATLIVSRSPLSDASINRLTQVANGLGYNRLITPSNEPASATLRNIVNAGDLVALRKYTRTLALDLTPATDNRPFFFNQLPLSRVANVTNLAGLRAVLTGGGVAAGNLSATLTLCMLFVLSLALVVVTIVIPLRPAVRDVGWRLAIGGTLYFILIGVGFMSIEIGLLQRLSIFLGHPIYSLSVVLFSIILAAGVGSILSEHYSLGTSTRRLVTWSVLTAAYFVSLPLYLSPITLVFAGEPLIIRVTLSVLIITPGALLMGWGFPTGMRLVAHVDRRPTPWFWGINGAAGVLASTMAVATSIAFGIGVTISLGGLCYLLLVVPALLIAAEARANQRSV
jgi:hypothetical protein